MEKLWDAVIFFLRLNFVFFLIYLTKTGNSDRIMVLVNLTRTDGDRLDSGLSGLMKFEAVVFLKVQVKRQR